MNLGKSFESALDVARVARMSLADIEAAGTREPLKAARHAGELASYLADVTTNRVVLGAIGSKRRAALSNLRGILS